MEIKFTYHARVRMRERSIDDVDVRETITHPEYRQLIGQEMYRVRKKFRKEILEVVYRNRTSYKLVITTYYLE